MSPQPRLELRTVTLVPTSDPKLWLMATPWTLRAGLGCTGQLQRHNNGMEPQLTLLHHHRLILLPPTPLHLPLEPVVAAASLRLAHLAHQAVRAGLDWLDGLEIRAAPAGTALRPPAPTSRTTGASNV